MGGIKWLQKIALFYPEEVKNILQMLIMSFFHFCYSNDHTIQCIILKCNEYLGGGKENIGGFLN